MLGEIPYPFPAFNGCIVEVGEWINDFTPHFIITFPWYYDIMECYNSSSKINGKNDKLPLKFKKEWETSPRQKTWDMTMNLYANTTWTTLVNEGQP